MNSLVDVIDAHKRTGQRRSCYSLASSGTPSLNQSTRSVESPVGSRRASKWAVPFSGTSGASLMGWVNRGAVWVSARSAVT